MIERKKYGITPLSASRKEKYISGAEDFGTAARRGHGFHTRPCLSVCLSVQTTRYVMGLCNPTEFSEVRGRLWLGDEIRPICTKGT